MLKIADLVEDTPSERDKIVEYLRTLKHCTGHGEGFDWPNFEEQLKSFKLLVELQEILNLKSLFSMTVAPLFKNKAIASNESK